MHIKTLLSLLGFLSVSFLLQAKDTTPALAIANLTDPAKLATLKGERAANPRLQKCVYWLAYAEEQLGAKGSSSLFTLARITNSVI